MSDASNLIRRARELIVILEGGESAHEIKIPGMGAGIDSTFNGCCFKDHCREAKLLLGKLADVLERLRNENARLKGSTFYQCPDCGAARMGED